MASVPEKPVGMSVQEAAAQLGVAVGTLYELAKKGELPHCRRLGKRLIIHRQAFSEWLKSGWGN